MSTTDLTIEEEERKDNSVIQPTHDEQFERSLNTVLNKKRSVYISEQGKKNLLKYKYSGSDHSLISPFLQPFWNWVVDFLPSTMAPNTVTFVGFLGLVAAYLLTAFFCSDIEGPMPAWAYIANIALLFWYQTLDAIDGKQARKTGSSSPLGELFDHGCDALGSMLQTMTVAMVAQMGSNWQTWIILAVINLMFFFSIWEQYYTHVLNFHVLAGPTEGEFIAMLVNLVTLIFGIRIWQVSLLEYLFPGKFTDIPVLNWISLHNALFFGVVLSSIPTIYSNVTNVMNASQQARNVDLENPRHTAEEAQRLNERFMNITPIQSLFPYFVLLICWVLWMYFSPAGLIYNYTLLSCSTFGIISAYLVTRVVLARVCDEILPKFYYILVPLPFLTTLAMVSDTLLSAQSGEQQADIDLYAMIAYLIYVLCFYAHFVYDVVENITEFLGIYCFSIAKRNQTLF